MVFRHYEHESDFSILFQDFSALSQYLLQLLDRNHLTSGDNQKQLCSIAEQFLKETHLPPLEKALAAKMFLSLMVHDHLDQEVSDKLKATVDSMKEHEILDLLLSIEAKLMAEVKEYFYLTEDASAPPPAGTVLTTKDMRHFWTTPVLADDQLNRVLEIIIKRIIKDTRRKISNTSHLLFRDPTGRPVIQPYKVSDPDSGEPIKIGAFMSNGGLGIYTED